MFVNLLAVAAAFSPFLSAFMSIFKPLLPQPSNPDRQDAVVRVATVGAGLVLAVGCYLFTAATFSRTGLGDAIAEGGIAALMATGLWHGVTGATAAFGGLGVSVGKSATPAVAPSFTPIPHDPLNPPAAPSPAPAASAPTPTAAP